MAPIRADNYCIRPDYLPNLSSVTLDTDERTFWHPSRIRSGLYYQWDVYLYARRLIVERGLKTVLDIGCGPAGKLMSLIAPVASVYGIDQESAIRYCRETYGHQGHFYADNFENPSTDIETVFDLVICSDVIEHLHEPDTLLNYVRRFCNSDTLVIFSTPDRIRLRGPKLLTSPKAEHVREWSYAEFAKYLSSRGFRLLDHRHLPPVRSGINRFALLEMVLQYSRLRPYRYNQLALCQIG
jgi:2-polyprenyl-3-methyl-5-hydroxy-6-metoxy-1,4-benzoquinol methylase